MLCGDFVKQIEIGQSQKVAKKWMNCMRATEFWREQSMMQSLIHGEIPWHLHATFCICIFLHIKVSATISSFFKKYQCEKNINTTIEKNWKKLSQTITTYELFWYPLIFVPLYISQLYMLQWNLFFHFSQPTFNDCRKQLFELGPNELYTIMSSKFCLASQF